MTIYVDEPREYDTVFTRKRAWRWWCHMSMDGKSGTRAELVAFARQLGLRESYIQHDGRPTVHFDLLTDRYGGGKRADAIKAGAVPLDSMTFVRKTSLARVCARKGVHEAGHDGVTCCRCGELVVQAPDPAWKTRCGQEGRCADCGVQTHVVAYFPGPTGSAEGLWTGEMLTPVYLCWSCCETRDGRQA